MGTKKSAWFLGAIYSAVTIGQYAILTASTGAIRKVDFSNKSYLIPILPDEAPKFRHLGVYKNGVQVTLHAGEYRPMRGEESDWSFIKLRSIDYGDITGDGQDEAAVSLLLKAGGTQTRGIILVYSMARGEPVLIDAFWTGDRAGGGLHRIAIDRGQFIVEYYVAQGANGYCCPT